MKQKNIKNPEKMWKKTNAREAETYFFSLFLALDVITMRIWLKITLKIKPHWKTTETTLKNFTKDKHTDFFLFNHAEICLLLLSKNVNAL